MFIDHELGYDKKSVASAIVPKGALGHWDDYFVYGVACINVSGVYHLFYSGTRNVGANPRLEGSVGLSTSTDKVTWTKQGMVIDKGDVPDLGLSPFSILEYGGTYYLFCAIFNDTGTFYNSCVLSSTDLLNWTYLGKLVGLDARAHSPYVIEDPADSDKLIIFYTSMMPSPGPRIMRASADKTDPTVWTGNTPVTSFPSIYPAVRWEGDRFRMFFAMPVSHGYRLYASASLDGASFPTTNLIAIQPGTGGAWDESYITTPSICDDMLLYSARKTNGLGYEGIGMARLEPIGGTLGWDWVEGGVGPVVLPDSTAGMRLVGGSKGTPVALVHSRGSNKRYELVIYDEMSTASGFQNTFRVTNAGNMGPVLGIFRGASASKYIYRLTGSGTWQVSTISRTAGLHTLTFDVRDTGTEMKIDGVTVATDTAFNPAVYFTSGAYGYVGGTGLVKSFSITDL